MPVDVKGGIPMWGKIGLGVVGAGAVIYAIDESGNGGNGGAIFTTGNVLAIDSNFQLNRAGDGGSADAANTGGDGGESA